MSRALDILIIGDSWGVPNYQGPPGDPPETHTEFLLTAQGHRVTNLAINASGNWKPISEALIWAETHTADWIIWFHTEMLRDSHLGDRDRRPYLIQDLTEEIAVEIYQRFQDLQIKTGAKAVVIGGQAPVLDSFGQHGCADLVIPDWRSLILGQSLPVVHSLCTPQLLDSRLCRDSIDQRLRLLDQHQEILDRMRDSADFPDNCHPGRNPHRQLVEQLSSLW